MARSSIFNSLEDDDRKKKKRAIDLIGGSSETEAYQKRIFNREKADTFKAEDDAKIAKTKNRFGNLKERLGMSLSRRFGKRDDTTELKSIGESIKEIPSKQGFVTEAVDKWQQNKEQKRQETFRNTFLDIEQAKKDLDDEVLRIQGRIASQGQPLRDMGKPLTLQEETKKLEKKVSLMGGKDQLENKGSIKRGTFEGDIAETQQLADLLQESKETLQLLREYSGEVETKGGFLSGLTSALKDPEGAYKTFVPFGGDVYATLETVHDAKEINKIYNKIANGEKLTITERAFYQEYKNQILSEMIKKGVGYEIGKTIASLPKYALEFAITGGIATGIAKGLGRVGTKSALTKTLETASKAGVRKTIGTISRKEAKEIGVDLVRSSIANAGRTGIGFAPTVSRKTAEFMSDDMALLQGENGDLVVQKVGEGDSFWKALAKAYASTYVEVGAESVGILANVPLARTKSGVMGILGRHITEPDKFLQKAILAKFATKRGLVSSESISKLASKVGWNGVIEEVFEEETTELLQAPIEERKYYAPWTPQGMERLLVETLAIGAFGGLARVAQAPIPTGRIDTTGGKGEEETTQKPTDDDMVFDLEKEGVVVSDKVEADTKTVEQELPQEAMGEDTLQSIPSQLEDLVQEAQQMDKKEFSEKYGYLFEGVANVDSTYSFNGTAEEFYDTAMKYPTIETEEAQESEPTKDELNEVLKPAKVEAMNNPKQDPLIEEARKYKSAEEFVAQYKGSGTQYGKYDPSMRVGGTPGSKRLTELGIDPNKEITIYRGIDNIDGKVPRKIQDGDFVTADYETARAYASSDKDVVSIKVKAKDLFADDPAEFTSEPFYTGSEYIYSTKNASTKDLTKSQLTDIWNKANKPKPILKTNKEKGEAFAGSKESKKTAMARPTSKTSKARPSESQIAQVFQELDASEAGERFRTTEGDWIGKNSTFPDWITSPDLRDRGIIDKVLGYLRSGKEPPERFGKIRALYDMALEEAQTREADVEADREIEKDKKDAIKKKKANEIKVGDISTSKDRKIATTKPVASKGKIKESRAFQNIKERLQDITEDDPIYNQMDLADNAVKAVEFVRKYPKRAEKISMGMELPPSGMTQTAITLAYSEALGLTGKHAKRVQVEKVLSLMLTRLGQEIVSLRGRINTDSSPYFIQKVLEARKNLLASGWKLPSYVQKIGGKPIETNARKVATKISADAQSLKSRIDAKVLEDLGSAQAFIDSITC